MARQSPVETFRAIPSRVLFAIAGFLWASFLILGYLGGLFEGTAAQFPVVIAAVTDLCLAVVLTITALIRIMVGDSRLPRDDP